MPRSLPGALLTASQQDAITPIMMVALDFSSGFVRAHTGVGTIVYGGNSYLGVGTLGGISTVQETGELGANGVTLTLSGVDPANISRALGEHYQGRSATIYLGLADTATSVLIDAVTLFKGRMDTQTITLGEQGAISLKIESPVADWARPRVRRYNNADQQKLYPGDKGLEFAEQTVDKTIKWGD